MGMFTTKDGTQIIIHSDDDQVVTIGASAHRSAKIIQGATLKVYPRAPHGPGATHKDQLNADLLAFLKS